MNRNKIVNACCIPGPAPPDVGAIEMRVARPTSKKNLGSVEPHTQPSQQPHPEGSPQSLAILLPTAETYRRRAEEAKSLAKQCRDVWEREILLRVATQWQLLAAHRDVKESKQRSVASNVTGA
jgi:hypothetical protein